MGLLYLSANDNNLDKSHYNDHGGNDDYDRFNDGHNDHDDLSDHDNDYGYGALIRSRVARRGAH